MAEIIDAHHHLWNYDPEQFAWISSEMQALQRNFLPGDLAPELLTAGVTGTVVVQARQTLEETRWLLACAAEKNAIRGVVGWLPLADPRFPEILAPFLQDPLLKGLRHVVQDELDDRFILQPAFNHGVAALNGTGLVYDILIHPRHLRYAAEFAANHPQQVFVLDHLAKPAVGGPDFEAWRSGLELLAANNHVHCKLSGLVTEANWRTWTPADLRPYLDTALTIFGTERLLAGSDWPVCLLASSYERWWATLEGWAASLTSRERELIFSGNAIRVYQLDGT